MAEGAAESARVRAKYVLANLVHPTTRMLDVGAGCGHLVAAFRDLGLVADGIEPSVAGRERAAGEYGLRLRGDFDGVATEVYDLITLNHSLEHVAEPLALLRVLAGILRPSGTLFIEVPHAGSIELWRPSQRLMILDLPLHLFHFTPDSLGRLVSAAGLTVWRTELFSCDAVEWLIRQRARIMGRPAAEAVTAGRTIAQAGHEPALRVWGKRAVQRVRLLAPGWKFQIFAGRP